jgi:hypothetical protein
VKRYGKGERDVGAVELRVAALDGAKVFTFTPEVARYVAASLEKAVSECGSRDGRRHAQPDLLRAHRRAR